ncbi:MAG: hypothetical protein QOE29_1455 [Gaiellaceae bacterium]|nr:hypothetical protein [Gaiellaceae bacterium]
MPVTYLNTSVFTLNRPLVEAFFEARPEARKNLRIFFQNEHNLVLPGGRDVTPSDPLGAVSSIFDPDERYHVRIVNKPLYASADVVVEYNRPNIENLQRSAVFPDEVLRKIVYAPPLPFDYDNGRERDLPVITTFVREEEPRRALVMKELSERCAGYRNVQGVYDLDGLRELYSSTQILVNCHQTWHHHAIEEFRVLPALSRGAIVISEDVPLRGSIPYHEYILWCSYEEIPDLVADVSRRYESTFEAIHGGASGLPKLLEAMRREFEESLESLLADGAHFSVAARMRRSATRGSHALRAGRAAGIGARAKRGARRLARLATARRRAS